MNEVICSENMVITSYFLVLMIRGVDSSLLVNSFGWVVLDLVHT